MFQMMGVFAEFERAMIQARVKSGVARARAAGTVFGRPRVSAEVERAMRELRAQGVGIGSVARRLNIGASVLQRVERENAAQAAAYSLRSIARWPIVVQRPPLPVNRQGGAG
jgi:DNA invertase Pin-like site-specific DNA recombinase